ncbi:MAG TPA: HNH endonuclease family protein [Nocardioides sp.]|jgi:hypothetical protein|nr:HNH endonuclease family protein [Nocardioides sp.]
MATTSYDVLRGLGLVAVLLVLAGCGAASSSSTPGGRSGQPSGRPSGHPGHHSGHHSGGHRHDVPPAQAPPRATQARTALDALAVAPRPRGTEGYRRDAFGSSWIDTDHDGCNQRDDVLLRDAVPGSTTVAQQGACDHDVLAGTWHDPYTGRTLTFTDLKDLHQAEAIQIDHVVPLAEAWVSGARRWGRAERESFANDLHELLAVDGPTNMSKGDGDPASWRPRRGYQCTYARRWIAIKAAWHLAVDPAEVAALRQMLGYC